MGGTGQGGATRRPWRAGQRLCGCASPLAPCTCSFAAGGGQEAVRAPLPAVSPLRFPLPPPPHLLVGRRGGKDAVEAEVAGRQPRVVEGDAGGLAGVLRVRLVRALRPLRVAAGVPGAGRAGRGRRVGGGEVAGGGEAGRGAAERSASWGLALLGAGALLGPRARSHLSGLNLTATLSPSLPVPALVSGEAGILPGSESLPPGTPLR